VIIRHARIDEPAAYRRMQQLASANNKKLVEIARMILIGAEALSPVTPKVN
jgi:AmiR/NasT family two-component response regulator